jgi:3-methyladenine DNA glycosylase Mpg
MAGTRRRLDGAIFMHNAPELAPRLLGKWLCRRLGRRTLRLRITETEAKRIATFYKV